MLGERLVAASPHSAVLSDGRRIATRTLISTVPSSPNPVVEQLGLPTVRGRLECDATIAVKGCDGVWAVGDCASIPMPRRRALPAHRAARDPPGEARWRRTSSHLQPARGDARSRSPALASSARSATGGPSPSCRAGFTVEGLPRGSCGAASTGRSSPGASRKTRVAVSWFSDLVLPPTPSSSTWAAAGAPPRPTTSRARPSSRRATPATACS